MSEYIKMQLEEADRKERKELLKKGEKNYNAYRESVEADDLFKPKKDRIQLEHEYNKFKRHLNKVYLAEAIHYIYNKTIDISESSEVSSPSIRMAYVNNFIEESGGPFKLINEFKSKSPLLSSISTMVVEAVKKNMEDVDKDDVDSFLLNTQVKSDFVEDLNDKDVDDVVSAVQTKVADSVNSFIEKNKKDKEDINKIVDDSKEKIDSTNNDAVKESYIRTATQKVNAIKNKKSNTIFEQMVRHITKEVIKEDYAKEVFMQDNKINFDLVMESAVTMYSFLETVNTTKMVLVDEAYIEKIYKELS